MFDYDIIKALAKVAGRSVRDLLALSPANDPFYAGVGSRGKACLLYTSDAADDIVRV